jgi:hypothetical protein
VVDDSPFPHRHKLRAAAGRRCRQSLATTPTSLEEPHRRGGGDRLPRQTDPRVNPFALLQESDHLEQVAGLWVALGPHDPNLRDGGLGFRVVVSVGFF